MVDRNGIMGNPFAHTPGWDLMVSLDPGTLGQPSLGFSFRFSKDGSDSRNQEDYNTFAVGWEPGVEIGGQWMMEDLQFFEASNSSDPELIGFTLQPPIRKLLDEIPDSRKKADMVPNLICATFRSNVHKTPPVNPKWALTLPDDASDAPYTNLDRMFDPESSGYQVSIWFVNRYASFEDFCNGCLRPLADAVADNTPPFHRYLYENDEPFLDYRLPTIHEIGNGVYRRYPKVVDHTDKWIENRSVTPTYFNLPKIVTWDSIKTYYLGEVGQKWQRNMCGPSNMRG